ncbi:MAG: pyridoxine 5'-phosphate synthase [Pirellulaceae bacterium]|nr:MAG: pyridoxine 5'-phosphate synthase [Pirellulaceae bacterium]
MPELGVNIDHVATIRQARRTYEPDPVWAAVAAELGGADGITVHLREDRRHIQDRDVRLLREVVSVKLNLEMAAAESIVNFAVEVRPDQATLVPERRQEVTTEGGLDLLGSSLPAIQRAIDALKAAAIRVSLFLDPDPKQIEKAAQLGVDAVELHTGQYALAQGAARRRAYVALLDAARAVHNARLALHAGHGLNYQNVRPVAAIPHMRELNIGHAIVSRAVFVGMQEAVRQMKALVTLPNEDPANHLA